jgi:hypothetical protein
MSGRLSNIACVTAWLLLLLLLVLGRMPSLRQLPGTCQQQSCLYHCMYTLPAGHADRWCGNITTTSETTLAGAAY